MRVAHVITRMIVGGAQENTLLNCLDLVEDFGDEVKLFTGPSLGPEGSLIEQSRGGDLPFQVELIDSLRRNIHPHWDRLAYRELTRAIREFKPDVVHTHSAKGGLLGRAVGWKLKVPAVIHTVHGAPFHPYQSSLARFFFQRCEKWGAKRCHRMISVADAMTDLMTDANIAPSAKFQTIYSGMSVEPYLDSNQHRQLVRNELGFAPDDIVIGKIARLFHLKGHDELVAAAKRVVDTNPKVKFLLVGDGILRPEIEKQIADLGLTDHFSFTGLVPPSDIPKYLGAMDLLVHTSLREGLARTLPQALLAGKPVISYDIDGAREVCITGETGILVPARDQDRLAEAMIELAGDESRRQTLGQHGQQLCRERFDHHRMTAQIRQLYQEVLDSEH